MTLQKVVGALAVLAILAAGAYWGYFRNEERCTAMLDQQILEDIQTLDLWLEDKPDYVTQTNLELLETKAALTKDRMTLTLMRSDPHRHACDYYVPGFELRRK